jgi:hypothetical protein
MSVMLSAGAILALSVSPSACPDVLDYSRWSEAPGQAWGYRDDRLTIIGAEHVRDPAHGQFARIRAAFAEARPTIVFYEGPDRGVRADSDATIRETGESGYARFLAGEAGIAARSLEPSPGEQIQALAKAFPLDRVMLFFTLREAARLRDREQRVGARLDEAMAAMLAKAAALGQSAGVAMPFTDIDGLQEAFAAHWPGRDWRTADAGWFSPLADDAKTGGLFMAAINRADSANRNRHMARLFAAAVEAGERPFVVVGRNHVPMIAPVLDCALRR